MADCNKVFSNPACRSEYAFLCRTYERFLTAYAGYTDDRLIFCNVYRILLESLFAMDSVSDTLVWSGYYRVFDEQIAVLSSICSRFPLDKGVIG